jgi:type IV secretory pathway VirB4 component
LAKNEKVAKGNKKDLRAVSNASPKKKQGIFGILFGGKDVPKTAQDTIPYKHIYKDGICALPDGKYNKTITFQDINYQLAQTEDQQRIFNSYCKFLNYFDPSVEVQLSFVNKFGNKRDIVESIDIPDREDRFNSIREEYREMLKNQLAKGNNGLVKHKYVTFTIEAKNLRIAKTRLERMEADVINNFKMMGVRSWSLNGKERVQLLHSQLHPDGKEKVLFDWNDLAKTGMNTKDIISPSSFEFKGTRDFKMGATYGSVRFVQIIATELPDDLLNQFLNMESALTVSIHLKTIEHGAAIKIVKRKLSDIDSMKITEQKKAVKNGYDMDIMPSDLLTYGEDAQNLLKELQSRNERMFLVTVIVMNMANTKSKLDNEILTASGISQKENCALKPLDFQQEQGMVSSLAIGKNEIEIERTLTTSSTAIFVPFTTSELFEDGQTMYYGLNALSNNLIMCNRKNLVNPNGLILGLPGSGKSFSAKREMTNVFLVTDDDIIIVDPEGEYFPLVSRLEGQVINLSQNSSDYVNPFDIHKDYGDGEDPIALKSNFILSLCELVVGSKEGGLQPEEKSIIDRCVRKMYSIYFQEPQPEKMPILEDLYNLLLEEANKGKEAANYIASALELYVTGSLNVFNRRTNVNLDNRLVCFNIKELQSHLKAIGMLILQDAVWGRVSLNREQKRKTWLYIDEFHLLLKDEQTASYSVGIWKRFRKWGGVPTGITQNVKDLLSSREVENIFENTPFIIMLNQAAGDRAVLAKSLGISPEQLSFVTQSGAGEGLLFFGHVIIPFLDRFPRETELYRLMTTRIEEVS